MFIIILGILVVDSGCTRVFNKGENPSSMKKIYINAEKQGKVDAMNAIAQQFKINRALGYVKPYVPVINPPVVKRAWIVPHETKSGALTGGYWVYIIVKKPSWYIQTPSVNLPTIIIPYVNKRGKNDNRK